MAHFAKLNQQNIVEQVIVIANDVLLDDNGVEQEQRGVAFCAMLFSYPYWIQTSYNGNFRKNYAGIGYTYDSRLDAFVPPQPYPSWVLDESTCQWQAPVPMPTDGLYQWDDGAGAWVAMG